MNKKIIIIPIAIIIGIIGTNFLFDEPNEKDSKKEVFHVTLADPNLYINGVYTHEFTIDKGEYSFRFVPNGSSPEILSIILNGENFEFNEDFLLEGTLHQTGISEYYTWKYNGQNTILIPEMQKMSIVIDPNGMMKGSVSVYISEN